MTDTIEAGYLIQLDKLKAENRALKAEHRELKKEYKDIIAPKEKKKPSWRQSPMTLEEE